MSDFMRFHMAVGTYDRTCAELGFDWPPPEYVLLNGGGEMTAVTLDEFAALSEEDAQAVFRRESFSQITDVDIAAMTHVARGAEYRYLAEGGQR